MHDLDISGQIDIHDLDISRQIDIHDLDISGQIDIHDLDISGQIDIHDLDISGQIDSWSMIEHMLPGGSRINCMNVGMSPGLDLYYTDPAQHILTTG